MTDTDTLRAALERAEHPLPWTIYSEPDVGLPPTIFSGHVGQSGFCPVDLYLPGNQHLIVTALGAVCAAEPAEYDWLAIARLAGEHGIRYRTNTALEQFLAALATLSKPEPAAVGIDEGARYRRALERIRQATLDGKVCDDVAWFDEITTLHDFIDMTLTPDPEAVVADLFPAPYEFDRYINGQLMAEGVTIEREKTLEDACRVAARIASHGPNGEAPILVYRRASPVPSVGAEEKAIRHDEHKKIIAQGCIHTRKAVERLRERSDLIVWQTAQSEWFDPTILEIVSEYAEWRDGQSSEAISPPDARAVVEARSDYDVCQELLTKHGVKPTLKEEGEKGPPMIHSVNIVSAMIEFAALRSGASTACKVINRTDLLREWFGGERYARDYEYLDANYGAQADRVVAYFVGATQ